MTGAGRPLVHAGGRVLVVDDEPALLKVVTQVLERAGHQVQPASGGGEAITCLRAGVFDAVVSDIAMPGMSGIDLLRAVRQHDIDLPVVVVTGTPEVATAIQAVEYGALRYLVKPIVPSVLLPIVDYAVRMCRLARVKREALALVGDAERFVGDRAALELSFARALRDAWMAYQPIVVWPGGTVYGYEALLRSSDALLGSATALISGADRLGRLHELGRVIRGAVASQAEQLVDATLFVNLHPEDLNDETLYDAASPLSAHAPRIVLEVTERATLDRVPDLSARLSALRTMGYRLALDDLGAGYAGLTSLAQLRPEVVKLDMSLVRHVDRNATKRKLVGTMTRLAREMDMIVVVEGVETERERDALLDLECDLFQGFLFGKPEALRP